jgi:penicillin-binding protein 1C
MLKEVFTRRRIAIGLLLALAFLIYLFVTCLPEPLFRTPVSIVLLDKEDNLLGASIADDGQWRFPAQKNISGKFIQSIICFEDKRFYHHPGVDPISFVRAIKDNIKAGRIKSGGSTITMQVIRLVRKGKQRTVTEKLIEICMALRLECSYSKNEIINLYASYAPFGGNVAGLDAAAWRYFGKQQQDISWGEAALFAVLPNNPSMIRPGKNSDKLLQKRNRLLNKLFLTGKIDKNTCHLAQNEPLPGKPYALPRTAGHLLTRISNEKKSEKNNFHSLVHSTLNIELQKRVNDIIEKHHKELSANGINNAAALVAEVSSGNVLAYVGNIDHPENAELNSDVDVITAPRSTGSILKPFLFASMLSEGEILPGTLIADIPTQIAGYSPQNFNKEYDGAVPARRALERSLNIPAVRMLKSYGIGKFNYLLKKMGMTTLNKPADYYGLSIILGGAEGSLWDVAGMYASMARVLKNFGKNSGRYDVNDIHSLHFTKSTENKTKPSFELLNEKGTLSAGSIWSTLNAMEEVNRPELENNWKEFTSSKRIAWKTGTSFGFRDGWAIGVTQRYVVAVWVGNADGEGRPGLTGIATAAPILFDIFNTLPSSSWFDQPYDDMEKVSICSKSGYLSSDICEEKDSLWIPRAGLQTSACPYHQMIHLDPTGKFRVTSDCESPSRMIHKSWFVLPPAQEWYYKSKNVNYKVLPEFLKDCASHGKNLAMEFIYPKKSTQIYVPIELDGKTGKTIFEVAHRNSEAKIYWHLDDEYIGTTRHFHQMALSPSPGKHFITLVDENGERLELQIEILDKGLK